MIEASVELERSSLRAAGPLGGYRVSAEPLLLAAEESSREGNAAAALAAYEAALDAEPTNPGALIGLAGTLLVHGNAARAQLLLLRCCGVAPDLALAWALLGCALRASRDFAAAETAFAKAQRLEPEDYDHALHRMAAADEAGRSELELNRLEIASRADPLDAVLLTARGALLERLGRVNDAIDVLEAAVLLDPDARAPALELANALLHSPRGDAAEAALSRAIELVPDQPLLRSNRAAVLTRLHRHREAVAEFRAMMEAHGTTPHALCNLATALIALGEQDAAVEAAREATRLAPDMHMSWRALMNAIAYQDGVTATEMLRVARRAGAVARREVLGPLRNTPDPHRRIRVGLLSRMLKSHPVGWLTIAGLENLDPRLFDIVCIGQARTGDPIERRFRAIASSWHDADALQRHGLASGIRALELDMLIDLSGYGERGMMAVCASRIAPVQIKWVGMQNHSTGIAEMDWFITDRWETPPCLEATYSERLLRMPDGYAVYSPPPYAPDVGPLPALRRGAVTFGCFNNIAKVTPRVIACWSTILHRLPSARLIMKTHQMNDTETRERIRAGFVACGIDPARVELRGRSAHRVLLQQYGDIDIVLDPFPYVGGLTTCEALWMGVPTITVPGETFSSRHAASHMSNVGLADWVAADIDAYCDMAVGRAADLPALAALRAGMRARVKASPLCDGPRFGRHLGHALRAAWRDWCERGKDAFSRAAE
jgi:predicted O-linked N-acetylglucosamine transferase (SPINDLY family)